VDAEICNKKLISDGKQLVCRNIGLRERLRQLTEVRPKARQQHRKGLCIYKNRKPLFMVVARPNNAANF